MMYFNLTAYQENGPLELSLLCEQRRLGEPPDPAFVRSPSKYGLHVSMAGVWYTVCMTSRREDIPVAVSGKILVFNRLKAPPTREWTRTCLLARLPDWQTGLLFSNVDSSRLEASRCF
ncbi:unnamed protein product [Gadus morhua 'NCC']